MLTLSVKIPRVELAVLVAQVWRLASPDQVSLAVAALAVATAPAAAALQLAGPVVAAVAALVAAARARQGVQTPEAVAVAAATPMAALLVDQASSSFPFPRPTRRHSPVA